MKNEEAIEALIIMRDNCVSKHEYSDPMRGIKFHALETAIKALENQSKYENALELAVRNSDKSSTDVWCEDCGYEEDERLNKCWECGMKYYKRKVGLEAD